MNAPRDLGPDFHSWLRDVPPMPDELPARTLDQTRHTRQRRRRPWFLPALKPTAGAFDEHEDSPASSTSPTGEIGPQALRGTRTMLSPAKLVVAAAVLALAGGVASSGVLNMQQRDGSVPGVVPAAEAEPEFVVVEGSGAFGGAGRVTGRTEMSDPRVSGKWDITQEMVCSTVDAWACAKWGRATLSNEGGTWEGEWAGFHEPITVPGLPMGQHNIMSWLEGSGEYEGLSYISTLSGDPSNTVARGLIYEGPIPPTVAPETTTE